jgi:hypothetical protein
MTSLLQMQPSTYLKKEDIPVPTNVQIAEIKQEQIGQGADQELKPVLFFHGHDKGMVLNSINSQILVSLFGDNIESMIGQQVQLWVDSTVSFGGRLVGGLRLRAPQPTPAEVLPASNIGNVPTHVAPQQPAQTASQGFQAPPREPGSDDDVSW